MNKMFSENRKVLFRKSEKVGTNQNINIIFSLDEIRIKFYFLEHVPNKWGAIEYVIWHPDCYKVQIPGRVRFLYLY